MKPSKIFGAIVFGLMALTAIGTAFSHTWNINKQLQAEKNIAQQFSAS